MGGTSKLANFSPYEVKIWLTKIKKNQYNYKFSY